MLTETSWTARLLHHPSSTNRRRNLPPPLLSGAPIALGIVATLLAPFVRAQDTDALTFYGPFELTVCQPVNFAWSGGTTPQYNLEVGSHGTASASHRRQTDVSNSSWFFQWTPAGSTDPAVNIVVDGNDLTANSGGLSVQFSSNSSCLDMVVTASTAGSILSTSNNITALPASPTPERTSTSPAVLATSSKVKWDKGATIAAIALGTVIGVGFLALVAWLLWRRSSRNRTRQLELSKPTAFTLRSPASDLDATIEPYTVNLSGIPTAPASPRLAKLRSATVARVDETALEQDSGDTNRFGTALSPAADPEAESPRQPIPPQRIRVAEPRGQLVDSRERPGGSTRQPVDEEGATNHRRGKSERNVCRSVERGEAGGRERHRWSNSQGTTLPPYVP